MNDIGDYKAGSTIYHQWNTTGIGGESITRATNGTIRIYKNNGLTQRSSSNGITDSEDFDSLTGVHALTIDLSDNTDSGFYSVGGQYHIVLVGAIIDGVTVNVSIAMFTIEKRAWVDFLLANHNAANTFGDVDTTADIAAAVLNATLSSYLSAGSVGLAIHDTLIGQGSAGGETLDISDAAANKIADHVLRRSTANIEGSSDGDTLSHRSLYGAVAMARHKRNRSGSNFTIYKADDTTSLVVDVLTATAGLDPISTVDPPA